MQKHTENYLKATDKYSEVDLEFSPCEKCGMPAVDIHHKKKKSQGGGDEKENLIALCRFHHDREHGCG